MAWENHGTVWIYYHSDDGCDTKHSVMNNDDRLAKKRVLTYDSMMDTDTGSYWIDYFRCWLYCLGSYWSDSLHYIRGWLCCQCGKDLLPSCMVRWA
jgi:hypothetical protein